MKQANLNLKAVLKSQVNTLASQQAGVVSPAVEISGLKTKPEIAAGVAGPVLIVWAQVDNQQSCPWCQQLAGAGKNAGGRRHMVQHHIQDHQVIAFGPDSGACGLLNIRMPKVDFVPVLLTDHVFCPIEHNGRVIDGSNMRKLGSQGIDEFALARAHLKDPAAGGDLFIAEQVNNAAGILVEFGNQVLVLPQAFGVATKKCLRPRRRDSR